MSNTQVGNIYQQIIADVVESSRVDFEEVGVEEQVLEELKRGWQQKLSQLQVATFPWDPKPEPPQPIANPPTVPSNVGNYQPMSAPPNQPYVAQPTAGGRYIKSEPGLDSPTGGPPPQPYQPAPILPPTATTAQQRAAMNLQQNYGQRAAASISAIQGNMSQQQQQQGQPNMQQSQQYQAYQQQMAAAQLQQQQRPGGGVQNQRPQITQEQYRQQMAAQAAQAAQRLQAQGGVNGGVNGNVNGSVNGAQTDGAGDDIEESVSVIKRMNSSGEEVMGRVEIDGLIREKIAAMGQSMEGGGLMLPLHQATNSKKRQHKVKKSALGLGQLDGPGSDDDDKGNVKDEDLDEDAINSDLDDPEDGLNDDEEDDEGIGNIMLCMYDKVQRVKNKWKCVMKDGVLTVNGKEYVFHKANGEYEW